MEVINERSGIIGSAKKTFSRIGWACTVFVVILTAVQTMVVSLGMIFPDVAFFKSEIFNLISNYVPMYVIAMPIAALMMLGMKTEAPERNKLSVKNFFLFAIIGWFFMRVGMIISDLVGALIEQVTQTNSADILDFAVSDMSLVESFFALCIAAPIGEELIFRKVIVDRTKMHGEWPAIFVSAFTFSLFHTNIEQFVYAFLIGGLMAYVYLRYGNIWHTILMHAVINFFGGMLPLLINAFTSGGGTGIKIPGGAEPLEIAGGFDFKFIDTSTLSATLYEIISLGLAVVGLIMFIKSIRKVQLMPGENGLMKGEYATGMMRNSGMIIYIITAVIITAVLYLVMI